MARITVEDSIDKVPSRFELVLIASQRARKLHTGDQPTVERENDKNTVIALREIEEETISLENLKESLIKEFQVVSTLDKENEDYENAELELEEDKDLFKSLTEDEEIKSVESTEDEEIKSVESTEEKKLEEQYEDQSVVENIVSDSHEDQE